MKILIYVSLILAGNITLFCQDNSCKITGKITGSESKPLNGANIVIEGTIDGATSDSTGYFEFETDKSGTHSIIISAVGYNEKHETVNIEAGKNLELNVKLKMSEVATDEILVTASSYTSGQNSQVTLTPLEIVRIPGSDADLYRAITTFPGSNQVDEGSRLTVRGGDASEVLTVLDLASLQHPFIFDDDFNSSSYSTVNPWGLKGINFSSGGFSARFGNALSAVLDLKSYEMPQGTGAFIFVGLANASASGIYLSKSKKFGATFDFAHTFLEPYFKINGKLGADFNPIPLARGLGGTLSYKFSEDSYLKTVVDYSYDRVGIRNTGPSFDGYFNSNSTTYFANVKYSKGLSSSSTMNTGLSYSNHKKNITYGILNTSGNDIYAKYRLDITNRLSKKININTGTEYQYDETRFNGKVPRYSYNLRPDAASINVNSKIKTGRVGGYLEAQLKLSKTFFVIPGIRGDYHTLSKEFSFDPRFSLGYKFAKDNVLRASVGVYHQYPDLQFYSQSSNNNLKPQQAIHYILGYELNKMDGLLLFRVEAYYKDYKNLVSTDPNTYLYNSSGSGFAKGIDVFLKSKVTNKYSTWISYSYTDSKRKFNGMQISGDYDITHSMTTVASYSFNDNLTMGLTYRISTGKPYTDVTSSTFDSTQNVFVPYYETKNSSRFPTYHRVDMNAQYIFALFGKFAVAVFALNNVFNQTNLYGYTYNFDYTQKREIVTTNRRTVYVALGVGL